MTGMAKILHFRLQIRVPQTRVAIFYLLYTEYVIQIRTCALLSRVSNIHHEPKKWNYSTLNARKHTVILLSFSCCLVKHNLTLKWKSMDDMVALEKSFMLKFHYFFKDILDPYVTPRIKLSKKGCFKSLNLAWWLGFKITDFYWITEYHPFLAVFLRKS